MMTPQMGSPDGLLGLDSNVQVVFLFFPAIPSSLSFTEELTARTIIPGLMKSP